MRTTACPAGSGLSWVSVASENLPDNALSVGPSKFLIYGGNPNYPHRNSLTVVSKKIEAFAYFPVAERYQVLVHDPQKMSVGTRLYWRPVAYKNEPDWESRVVWAEGLGKHALFCSKEGPLYSENPRQYFAFQMLGTMKYPDLYHRGKWCLNDQ